LQAKEDWKNILALYRTCSARENLFGFRLNSFGNYLKTETVRHLNNSFHNRCIWPTLGDIADKTAVDF
jgi:hypothetical protein